LHSCYHCSNSRRIGREGQNPSPMKLDDGAKRSFPTCHDSLTVRSFGYQFRLRQNSFDFSRSTAFQPEGKGATGTTTPMASKLEPVSVKARTTHSYFFTHALSLSLEPPRLLVKEAKDLSSCLFTTGLFVSHNSVRSRKNDVTKLTTG